MALCTYNGGRYLAEQLESILNQTRLPDEVIIGDDGSTDRTLALLTAFAAQAPFAVRVLAANGRLGSTANFARTISACDGDWIALSDQDDQWHPSRLARSCLELERHTDACLLFSNADLMDEQGAPVSGSLWQKFAFAGKQQQRFASGDYSLLCRERFITGATVMLRRSALGPHLSIPSVWVHDAWLACVLSFAGDILALDEPLIRYRIHPQQQIGARVSHWQQRATLQAAAHWSRIHTERLQFESLENFLREHPPVVRVNLLADYHARAAFLRLRDKMPAARLARVAPILRNWQQYRREANGLPSICKDLFFSKASPEKEAPGANGPYQ